MHFYWICNTFATAFCRSATRPEILQHLSSDLLIFFKISSKRSLLSSKGKTHFLQPLPSGLLIFNINSLKKLFLTKPIFEGPLKRFAHFCSQEAPTSKNSSQRKSPNGISRLLIFRAPHTQRPIVRSGLAV